MCRDTPWGMYHQHRLPVGWVVAGPLGPLGRVEAGAAVSVVSSSAREIAFGRQR
jgi:hypothetical protein